MISRFVATRFALVAVLVACSAENPDSVPVGSASDTSSVGGGAVGSADLQPTDTTVHPTPSDTLITPDGWGPLRIGMTRAEVVAAAGEDANPGAMGGPNPEQCDEFRPSSAPAGVLLMLRNGILSRISVSRNTDIRTPENFRIGDTSASILASYGSRARVEPHQYWESPAKYITILREPSGAEPRGIRYEIDTEEKVAHIRAGGPSIEYVEGCV